MQPLTSLERRDANRRFHALRCQRRAYDAYWVEAHRMLVTRAVGGKNRIIAPEGGLHFGRYDPSADWSAFVVDLEDALKANPA